MEADRTDTTGDSQPGQSNGTRKVTLSALIAGTGKDKNRIVLTDSEGNPIGITMLFDDFDGKTKLRHDAKIDASLGLRPAKRIAAKNEALDWLFNLKCKEIQIDSEIDLEGVTDLKEFFRTNEGGIIWMRTATYEYIDRNRVMTEDAKN